MMTSRRWIVLAGVALATLAVGAQDGLRVQRSLVEGSVETYRVVSTIDETLLLPKGQGTREGSGKFVNTYRVKVGKADPSSKSVAVLIVNSVDSAEAGEAPTPLLGIRARRKTETTNGSMDARGFFVKNAPKDASKSLDLDFWEPPFFVELPDKAIQVGETWEMTFPLPHLKDLAEPKIEFGGVNKLVEERMVGSRAALAISSTGHFKIDGDVSRYMGSASGGKEGPAIFFKGSFQFKGDHLVEKATGKTLKSTLKITARVKFDIPSQALAMDSRLKSTVVSALK